MGILDEAIREHLELKRQHGAGDSELKKIEDEAFGPAERPGEAPAPALEEAPTEFLAQPEAATEEPEAAAPEDAGGRSRHEGPSVADLQEPPEIDHSTDEREAIAEQPTEMYDVEGELADAAPSPSDEELAEEEIVEPRLGPSDPLAGLEEGEEAEVSVEGPAPEEEEDDEFWSEQRLSDELDQALESPLEEEPQEEEPQEDEGAPVAEAEDAYEGEPAEREEARRGDDVLDDTPDFLEEAPEDDQLWFEQKPPKDFDFDD